MMRDSVVGWAKAAEELLLWRGASSAVPTATIHLRVAAGTAGLPLRPIQSVPAAFAHPTG
jgi:hypothetical protein